MAAAAWAGIVALAWWLADARIERGLYGQVENMAQVATRDNVLIWGLAIPLALFVALLIAGRVELGSISLTRFLRRPSERAPDCAPPPSPLAIPGPQAAADGDD